MVDALGNLALPPPSCVTLVNSPDVFVSPGMGAGGTAAPQHLPAPLGWAAHFLSWCGGAGPCLKLSELVILAQAACSTAAGLGRQVPPRHAAQR